MYTSISDLLLMGCSWVDTTVSPPNNLFRSDPVDRLNQERPKKDAREGPNKGSQRGPKGRAQEAPRHEPSKGPRKGQTSAQGKCPTIGLAHPWGALTWAVSTLS